MIERILSEQFSGTILTDGYSAYASYCRANQSVVHAQCWSHTRRKFIEAHDSEPELADRMLELIGVLYRVESDIRDENLQGEAKHARRQQFSAGVVDEIFALATKLRADPSLVPSNPFSKALQYLENRQDELRVFLSDPAVPVDTNHVERSIRAIALARPGSARKQRTRSTNKTRNAAVVDATVAIRAQASICNAIEVPPAAQNG